MEKSTAILVVTHDSLGETLIDIARSILDKTGDCAAVSITSGNIIGKSIESISYAIEKFGKDREVLILSDLFDGTPTTLSLTLHKTYTIEIVTGLNLPMLIEGLQHQDLPLHELAKKVRRAAIAGIVVVGDVLRKK